MTLDAGTRGRSDTASWGATLGLAAAVLYGASTPVQKILMRHTDAVTLAALLYLGAGLGFLAFGLARRGVSPEARLRKGDLPLLVAVTVTGGILGPILLNAGIGRLSGVTGSLLLNLEAPFTILLAVALFGEHLGGSAAAAVGFVLAGSFALGAGGGEGGLGGDLVGALCVAGGCLSWALDNNFSQRLSVRDPVAVVRVKTLAAGLATLALARTLGMPWPSPGIAAAALGVGFVSYGVALLLYILALRLLGAARQAAYFATAPFVGALAAVPVLGERPGPVQLLAGGLMLAGVWLLFRERHGHVHVHEPMEHDHVHSHDGHDEHHRHDHPGHEGPVAGPHSHPHRHERLVHDHEHVPDLHHRHGH
ncbi:MAG: EamA family transporter [Planctomycetales bacterium]|nr:EamA family transporter [Planctomycetales bacterium]